MYSFSPFQFRNPSLKKTLIIVRSRCFLHTPLL